jgi:tetratricopeptide (TPR) repeat protein
MKEEATSLFKEEKYPEAIEKFNECVEIDPLNANFNATLLLNISIAYEKLKNNVEKLKALNQAIKYNKKYAKALVRRGDHYLQQEEYMEAVKDYAEAIEHDPSGFNV